MRIGRGAGPGRCPVLAALLLCGWCAGRAQAAARGRYGGALRIAYAGDEPQRDPLLADSPSDAALLRLTVQGLCQWQIGDRTQPVLASEWVQTAARTWRVTLAANARFGSGRAIAARDVAASWARLNQPSSLSPYRAFLFPLRGEGKLLEAAVLSPSVLELSLHFAWPDLPKSLCHSALGILAPLGAEGALMTGVGPFLARPRGGLLELNSGFPLGRPYLDRLNIAFVSGRRAVRLFSLGQADVVLGEAEGSLRADPLPALYATYLAFLPERVGPDFRRDFEAAVDRAQLTQFFVRAASVPMFNLLPPALMTQSPPAPSSASARHADQQLTLLYDQALPEQRSVAERIQVKLHDRGYRITLKGLPRSDLRARWASGQFDLMLHAVLMPPIPGPALSLSLELARRRDLLASELPAIGAEPDAGRRDAKVRERALTLGTQLALIPLYAQSIVLTAARRWHLPFDGQGLPEFDNAFAIEE